MPLEAAPLPSLGIVLANETFDAGQFRFNRSDMPSSSATRLLYGRKLPADYGSLTLTGQDATLTEATPTAIAAAPLPIWSELTLAATGVYVAVGEPGIFAENGQDATLRKGRALTAAVGTFAFSGAPAQRDMELNGDVRLFQIVGQAATLTFARKFSADYGRLELTGQNAGYVLVSGVDRTMTGDPGAFYINRSNMPSTLATALRYQRTMVAEPATFAVNGQSAHLDGPVWTDQSPSSGTWVYVTPSGGTWTDVDPDA